MAEHRSVRSGSVVFPMLLIGFGVLILLTREFPNLNPWPVVGKYWPLILIFAGAGMFWDRSHRLRHPDAPAAFPVGAMLGTTLFLLVLLALIWRGHTYASREWPSHSAMISHKSESIDKKDAKSVRMSIKMPAGELTMSGGAESLLNADFSFGSSWHEPNIEYSVNNGAGELSIEQEGGGTLVTNSDNNWNLKVNNSIPIDLEIDIGAGRGILRFAKVDLTRLELNIGAGQADVDLSGERAKDLQAEIQGGVGEATIRLPKDVGVVAVVHGGLGSIDTHGLKEEDGQYVNAAYGKSPTTIHLSVNGGIGSIKLQQQ
ncbi:MAG TPA: toast rack family protein [Candidatus Acidoferrum sp.]|nr:toast rack family protein [Candidatus Acidoferrum sp.]